MQPVEMDAKATEISEKIGWALTPVERIVGSVERMMGTNGWQMPEHMPRWALRRTGASALVARSVFRSE